MMGHFFFFVLKTFLDYKFISGILFVDKGMAASYLKVQQMASVNNEHSTLPPNFLCKSDPSAICGMSSETRSTKSMLLLPMSQMSKDTCFRLTGPLFSSREYQSAYIRLLLDHLEDKHGSEVAIKVHQQYLMVLKDFKAMGYFMRHQIQETEEAGTDANLDLSSVLGDLPWSNFMV